MECEVPLDCWILEIGLEKRTGRGLPARGVAGVLQQLGQWVKLETRVWRE